MRLAASLRGFAMNARRRCSRVMKEFVMLSLQSRVGAGAGLFKFLRRAAWWRVSSWGM